MVSARGKTIEIFLPDGEPTGIKEAHIRTRSMVATYIPRARLNDAKSHESLQGVGLYMLVGGADEHAKPKVYIGEAECVFERLAQHNAKKDFWNYAIAFTSNNKHLTKTHVKFLEWLCHDKASIANRCILDNSTVPTKSHVQESTEADLYDNFESIELLLSTLGLNIFQPLTGQHLRLDIKENVRVVDVIDLRVLNPFDADFRIKNRRAEASRRYTQEGFIVFAGAHCSKEQTSAYPKIRDALIKDGILVDAGDFLELKEDYSFNSPSAAAEVVLGRSSNGWKEWTLEDGRTLHDIYRKEDVAYLQDLIGKEKQA